MTAVQQTCVKKPYRPADLRPSPVVRHNSSTSSVFAAAFEEVFGSFRIQPIQPETPENKEGRE